MKEILKKNKMIIILTFSILLFLFILLDIYRNEVTFYDNWAYSTFVENSRSEKTTLIMKLITSFGSGLVLISILVVMFLLYKNKKNILLASINLSIVFIINSILKIIIQRPRPSGYNLISESNYSFPSGHSMVSTAFYGFFIYLIYKNVENKKKKYLLISLLFLLIVLICISRIYLGVHYLSDTVGGFSLSLAYLMIYVSIIQNKRNESLK